MSLQPVKMNTPPTGIEELFDFNFDPNINLTPYHLKPKYPEHMNNAEIVLYAASKKNAAELIEKIYSWYSRKNHQWANYYMEMQKPELAKDLRAKAVFLKEVMAVSNNYIITEIKPHKNPIFVMTEKGIQP